jgi:hypothetical protein
MRCSRLSKLSSSSSCSCSTSMRRRTAPSHSSGSGSSLPRLRSLSSSADRLPEIVERVLEKLEREFVFVSVGILLVEEILPVLHEGGPMPMSRGGASFWAAGSDSAGGWCVTTFGPAQIVAGWLLSAIFLAGVTGLIRRD